MQCTTNLLIAARQRLKTPQFVLNRCMNLLNCGWKTNIVDVFSLFCLLQKNFEAMCDLFMN
jgi:hypothetical protein